MRAFTRPLLAAALVGGALLATPAQAAPPADSCVPACISDPFWLFRPCGPLIKCP